MTKSIKIHLKGYSTNRSGVVCGSTTMTRRETAKQEEVTCRNCLKFIGDEREVLDIRKNKPWKKSSWAQYQKKPKRKVVIDEKSFLEN